MARRFKITLTVEDSYKEEAEITKEEIINSYEAGYHLLNTEIDGLIIESCEVEELEDRR